MVGVKVVRGNLTGGIGPPKEAIMKKFPKSIYAHWVDTKDGDGYWEVNTELKHLPDEDLPVAIYELKEIKNLVNRKTLT